MNSRKDGDRSIALIDSAMRRRFAFVALDPREEPTRSLLRRWSERHGLPLVAADLLEEVNRRIDDPDFQVGPSYFMRSTEADAFSGARLQRIWSADILPLLEEHFYGQWESVARRFSLGSLMPPAVAPSRSGAAGSNPGGGGTAGEPTSLATEELLPTDDP